MALIDVDLGSRRYPILVVKKDRGDLKKLVKKYQGDRIFVIADSQVWALHSRFLTYALLTNPHARNLLSFRVSEQIKTSKTAHEIHDYLLANKINRQDIIVACGGGVTSDLVGYAASTVLRGVRWGIVSTTLMGMADAAIGGKTAVNHRLGKNLIGSIWQPDFVYSNTEVLQTLPSRHIIGGFGEIVKYAGLVGEPFLTEADNFLEKGNLYDEESLYRMVSISSALKAQIVQMDEREAGVRTFLNLGHTFAHALETATNYRRLLHGEAVLIGLLGALSLSHRVRPRSHVSLERYRNLVERAIGLVPKVGVETDAVYRAMSLDKKRTRTGLRFVLLKRPGQPILCENISVRDIRAAITEMLTRYKELGGTHASHTGRQRS